jgi:3',5'-cyclic AMP phosphodiesterase CpdA
VAIKLIHVSDLHVGGHEERSIETPLRELVERLSPALIVVTGDLTHRGRAEQHERAATFLRGLGSTVLAVPGNHDIPYSFPARFTRPWREFEARWETTEPILRSAELHVVGLNSARPWRHQSGGLDAAALERAADRLGEAEAGALRVVCLHHHLTGAPWRSRKRPVARRGHVLGALVDAGAELILSGHIHQSAASERREFEVGLTGEGSVAIVIAPGLGQPRPKRRGEALGLHVIDADEREIAVETHVFAGDEFTPIAARRFPRRTPPLSEHATSASDTSRGQPL